MRGAGSRGRRGRIRCRFAGALAVLTAAALLVLTGPAAGTAGAAVAADCAGRKVHTFAFSTGKLVVYKDDRYVCAVTYTKRPGVRQTMSVSIQVRGSRPARDKGRYTHHAGPVKVYVGHRCVWVRGKVGGRGISKGWILC
ncbi:hypothetical protein ACQB60_05655 [Actinomycetota bacterium Odt1-20B]